MIVAGNFKTNLNRAKTALHIESLENYLQTNNIKTDVIVFPAISSMDNHEGKVTIGSQNAYPAVSGAFTGEIGSMHLDEFGIKTILIGHSERRHILGETQEEIVKKFNFYKELGFRIIYCVGEPLEIREAGEKTMMEYISAQYKGIDSEYENLIIAYEPVWAIGTGLTPTLEDVESLHKELKKKSVAPLLYGGSVKVSNAGDIMALESVDGVLVGGASLVVENFSHMCKVAQELEER